MSSSDSATPQPDVRKASKKIKEKGKKKPSKIAVGEAKNEGVDPNWEYKPPPGVGLLQNTSDAGELEWETVANDEDLELWVIRIPDSIKPKYLENQTITITDPTVTTNIGTLSRKHAAFDIWSVGDKDNQGIGGEEIKHLSCLLPRKNKKGKLYPAPKPFLRHIVVSAQAVVPTPDPSSTGPIAPYARPPRENHPKELLTHVFTPYGSLSGTSDPIGGADVEMEIDVPATLPPTQGKSKNSSPESLEVEKKVKGKKRKGDTGDAPAEKKTKKAKTSKS
ncbi:hypothetical protein H0H81_006092 [Sphagnurus paluster]|uniref:Uncharacterized protein n=1 Tax=Sphagnurus paluster TaxID=117069 RepID=A0A9P7FW29_9AGAR|nr:hypothetical protein H0H81_006092 [Sphagnurus paluster]